MECSLETREDSGFRGKQYFSPELLPERLKARAFRLNGEGAFENREDVTVLSIRRGKGCHAVSVCHPALPPSSAGI